MIRLTRIFAIVTLSSLSACASQQSGLPSSETVGSELAVGSAASVPASDYSIWFQKGKQVSQRDIVLWDHYCNVRFSDARPQSWEWEEGRYQVIAYTWYDEYCGWDDCDLAERYNLKTLSGTPVEEITCRYRYIVHDPIAIMGPDLLSTDRLDAILGDYVHLHER